MKFTEIFSEFKAGKPIRRKSWPANAYITKTYDSKLSVAEMILQIADADDWELYVEPPYDEFLEEMKQYLYNDLEFYKSSQSRFYPEENIDIAEICGIIHNYYLDEKAIRKVLRYIKDNNLAKKM
jgi:hypothetical protein